MRDGAAAGDAAAHVHLRQASFENVAADIVEINIDAVRGSALQRLEEGAAFIIDGGIETEIVDKPGAFLCAAGNADDPATLDLGDLTDD